MTQSLQEVWVFTSFLKRWHIITLCVPAYISTNTVASINLILHQATDGKDIWLLQVSWSYAEKMHRDIPQASIAVE